VTKRVSIAILASACLSIVAGFYAFSGFDGIRIKFLEAPLLPSAGVARVAAPPGTRIDELKPPFAIIVHIRNGSATSHEFTILVDGSVACSRNVPPAAWRRLDCPMHAGLRAGTAHELSAQSPAADWELTYAELATHHGNTTGLAELRIVPVGFNQYDRVGPTGLTVLFLVFAVLLSLPGPSLPRAVTFTHRLTVGAALLALTAIVVAPSVSPFFVIVHVRTLVYWTVLLVFAPWVWVVVTKVAEAVSSRRLRPFLLNPLTGERRRRFILTVAGGGE
jgi:hypothetical protein